MALNHEEGCIEELNYDLDLAVYRVVVGVFRLDATDGTRQLRPEQKRRTAAAGGNRGPLARLNRRSPRSTQRLFRSSTARSYCIVG